MEKNGPCLAFSRELAIPYLWPGRNSETTLIQCITTIINPDARWAPKAHWNWRQLWPFVCLPSLLSRPSRCIVLVGPNKHQSNGHAADLETLHERFGQRSSSMAGSEPNCPLDTRTLVPKGWPRCLALSSPLASLLIERRSPFRGEARRRAHPMARRVHNGQTAEWLGPGARNQTLESFGAHFGARG